MRVKIPDFFSFVFSQNVLAKVIFSYFSKSIYMLYKLVVQTFANWCFRKISLDKLSRIVILITFARQTFAKKVKIREIRESFSH